MKPISPHNSMRGYLAYHLYEEMEINPNIYVVTADLGYGMFDTISADFSDRFINVGAAEQTALDVCVGLSMAGKIPFMYTITPFYHRGMETIRTYIDHENIPVIMLGSGRDDDYSHDGFSHDATDINNFMNLFDNVKQYYPEEKEEIKDLLIKVLKNRQPTFISLRR